MGYFLYYLVMGFFCLLLLAVVVAFVAVIYTGEWRNACDPDHHDCL